MNSDLILMLLIAILAVNQFSIRTQKWKEQMWLYWVAQISNVCFGSWLLLWGIPEFTNTLEVINILIGLLFFYHAIQNYRYLQQFQRELHREKRQNQRNESEDR